jgi:cation:H+ antiporter
MFSGLPFSVLIAIFAVAAAGVWIAGIQLSDATDILAERTGMGEALGGMIFLAVVTNLPEVAIVGSGAWRGDLGVAIGNILGGISAQTAVLVILDAFGLSKVAPLSCRAASPETVLEGVLVMAVLGVCIMGAQLPAKLAFGYIAPAETMIAAIWVIGLWIVGRMRNTPWPDDDPPAQAAEAECAPAESPAERRRYKNVSTGRTINMFLVGSVVTLVCGVILEISSHEIARHLGMTGVVFGATILAAATALPQVSTGLAAVKLGDFRMAVSDVLGGNAFLPVLLLMGALMTGRAVLPQAQATDIYLTGLGILLTAAYMTGLICRPTRQILRMGIDSFAVLVLYIVGIIGLVIIARGRG